jgi:hypothetical protein
MESTCHLVDLAGSERLKKSLTGEDTTLGPGSTPYTTTRGFGRAPGKLKDPMSDRPHGYMLPGAGGSLRSDPRFAEMLHINGSLSVLGRCVNQLLHNSKAGRKESGGRKKGAVPYRDSALTKILSKAFGGSCKTAMLVNIAQDPAHGAESLSSLRFGEQMGGVSLWCRFHSLVLLFLVTLPPPPPSRQVRNYSSTEGALSEDEKRRHIRYYHLLIHHNTQEYLKMSRKSFAEYELARKVGRRPLPVLLPDLEDPRLLAIVEAALQEKTAKAQLKAAKVGKFRVHHARRAGTLLRHERFAMGRIVGIRDLSSLVGATVADTLAWTDAMPSAQEQVWMRTSALKRNLLYATRSRRGDGRGSGKRSRRPPPARGAGGGGGASVVGPVPLPRGGAAAGGRG